MEDSRISTVDHEAVSNDLVSGDRNEGLAADINASRPLSQNADVAAFEVAQAAEQQANGKTERLAANEPQNADARQPIQIVPDNGNVVHLPPNTSIDDIHVEGRNLVLIQADGTRIVIINGALHVPTFLIGEVTLPQQAIVAALQQQGINVAEGPDGSVHAGNSTDSGHQFTDSQAPNARTPLNLIGLLGPGDIGGNGNGGNLSGTQTRVPFILQQATETASLIERGSSTGAFLTTSSTGRFGFGGNNASITTVTLVGEAEITSSGTQQLSGLTSGGVPVVVTQSGQTVTGVANGVTVFTLVFNASTGAYTFTQLAALDHPRGANSASDVLELQFRYTVSDTSGHTVSAVATVDITDSVPVAAVGTAGSVTEAALSAGNAALTHDTGAATATGSLNISWGADGGNTDKGGLGDRSVAFTNATVSATGEDNGALSSHGLAVHTALLADGTLVGYTGETAPTATSATNVVFYATVSDTDNGHYNFTLVQSLDDAKGSDAITLTFGYTATDSDGDTAANTFTITVADDKPVAATGDAGSVTEGALASGNETPHVETDAITTGSLNISWGADNANTNNGVAGDRSVAFTDASVAATGQDGEALSSHGLAVHTVLLADGTLVGYTGETAPTAVTNGEGGVGSNIVFYATVSDTDNGHYNFTLVQSLDDAKGSDAITLTFGYTATDSDGDTAANSFTITVADDKPVAATGDAGSVTEGALASGNETPHVETDAITTGSLNISWGADNANTNNGGAGDRSVAFTDASVTTQGQDGEALSSHGLAVHTVLLADGTLVGYTGETAPTAVTNGEGGVGSNIVFYATVSDTDNGHYNFTLVQSLDDAKGSDAITLTFGYTATDSDGDTATNSFTITVADDKPVAATGDAGSVTEGALASGNETPHVETDAITTGSLNISWGADNANTNNGVAGDRSVAFTDASVAATGQDGEALSSHGLAVHTVLLADGTLVGYTGETAPTAVTNGEGGVGSNIVFYATVSDTDNGHYNFTLVQSLDDAKGSDAITLTFGYTATDSDGDTATNTFTITVADDKPVAATGDAGSVIEGALASGNENPHVETDAITTGSLNISWGADNANTNNGGAGDRSVAFTDASVTTQGQDGEALSSHGLAVHTALLADGTLVGYTGEAAPTAVMDAKGAVGSNIVFYATVSDTDNGHYNFTLVQSLDDAKGSDAITLTFGYTATDSDGDTAANTFTITVADDKPVAATGDAGSVTEGALASGNETPHVETDAITTGSLNISWGADNANTNNGGAGDRSVAFTDASVTTQGQDGEALSSHGLAVHTAILADGTLVGYTGETAPTATSATNVVFYATVSDTDNGHYNFTLVQSLDDAKGSDAITLTFGYTATDSDGDTAANTFTITVADDKPVASTGDAGSVTEGALASGNETPHVETDAITTGSLNISWGADNANTNNGGAGDRSVAFTDASVTTQGQDGEALSSHGLAVHTVLLADGTLVGYTGEAAPTAVVDAKGGVGSNIVFYATVSDTDNGHYNFTLVQSLDDAKGSDAITLTFGYTATDSDGDTAANTFTITVADDKPVAATGDAGSVTEGALASGNETPHVETDAITTGSLNISWGADNANTNNGGAGDRSVAFTDASVAATGQDGEALSSHGLAVHTVLLADGTLVGYTGETAPTAVMNGEGGVGSNIVFYATVSDTDNGHYNFTLVQSLDDAKGSDAITLTFGYTATDSDGDTATNSFTITVADDKPIAQTIDNTVSPLNDDAQIGGNLDANDANAHSVSGAAGALFSAGADGSASVSIDQSSLPALKTIYVDANGFAQQEDVTWGKPTVSGGATTWVASSANHDTVATLTINADGSYTFSTSAPLVHPTSGTTEESLSLTFTFTVTDGDNDTSTGSLTLHVTDDVPLANTVTVTSVTLNDDALKGGNPDTVGVTDTDTVSGTCGTLFSGGADGVHQVTLGATTDFSAIYTGKDGFAHVESVVWDSPTTAAGGETIWIATGKDSGQTVATLTIGTDGSYSFTLSAPVVHAAAENTQDLTFNFTVTDGDSDTASGSLTVTVKDDAPIAYKVDATSTPLNDDAQAHGNLDGAADAKTINGDAGALFSAGADGVKGVSMDSLPTLKAIYLDSHGIGHQEAVSWTSSAANGVTTWTATGASSHATVAVLTINSDGSYSFTADAPLVHSTSSTTEDSLTLNFGFTVTDGDGDTAKGSLAIAITDDVLVASGTTVAVKADEGDIYNLLSHGNSALDGTHDGSSSQPALFGFGFAATVSGSVASTVSFGADGAAVGGGFSFTANAASTLTALHLTSGGEALSYAVVNNVIIGYVDNDHHSGYNPVLDRPVLSLSLSGNGSFTFQQYDQLDNVAGPGNDLRSGNSSISAIDFGSVIQATDGDGDSVTLTGALKVTIVDDTPKVDLALTGSITIDESGSGDNDVNASNAVKSLFAGITGGNDPDMSTVYAQHNVVSPAVSMGADDASGTTSSLTLHIDNADSGLTTTAGQAIMLSQLANGTVVGKIADGEIAFAIRLDNSGKVSIAQYMSLANPNTSKSDGDTVDLTGKLSAVLSATDSDGDTVAKSVSIGSSIRFDDDGPSIGGAVSAKTLAEHDLLTNSGSLSPSGISTGAVALNLAFGADGPAAHAATFVAGSNGSYFTASYSNNQTLDATKLSSGGHALSYSLSGDGMTLIAYTGSNAADQSSWVFKVVLSQDSGHASGAYDFTLYKSLDDVNGQSNLSDIKLTFQVAGHDGDGDTTSGTQSFSVDLIDDVPTLVDHASVSATVSETAINAPLVTTGSYTVDFDTVNPSAAKLTVSEGSVSDGHVESSSKGGDIVLVSNTGTTFVLAQMDIGVFDHKGASSKTVTIIGTDANGNTYSVTTTGTTFSAAGTALEGKQLTSLEIDPHDNSLTVTVDNIHVTDTTTTPTSNPAETTLDLTSLVHASADSPLTWSVNTVAAGTSSGNLTGGTGLTYNGTAITLASTDGHTITGSAGGVTVFTLTVDPASGHATFGLYHAIDGGKTLPLDFSKYVTATDFDGDAVTLGSGSVTIVVQSATDSLPTINSAGLVSSVSESGLPGGTGAAGVANVHSGSIAITAGDAPSTVTIAGHTFNVGATIANGDTNATIHGAYGTLHILSVTTTAINYTYTLTSTTSGASNHDAFSVTVSDAPIDGESQTATLTFNITDDKPIASTILVGSMHENDSSATFALASGTIAFGADGAAQSGAIHVDSVSANGDLAGSTLSTSMVTIDAGHVTVAPGSALDALPLGHSSILSIGYTVTDGDGSKTNGTFTIRVDGVNHAPTTADGSVSTGEHAAYYFSSKDFAFSDSIDGNTLKSVTITSLPTGGTLYLDGTAVTVGQHIAASALTTLHFTPSSDFAGATETANFGFTVQDNGGTANGGADTSTAHTMTVTVTAVDDGTAKVSIADQTTHTGNAVVAGDTLNAAIATDDPDHGQSGLTYAWSWADDQSHTVLGTASSYTVTSADVGHSLILTVSYTDGQGFSDVATQTTSAVIAPTVFTPTIDATPLSEANLSGGSNPQPSELTATGSIALGTLDNPHITSVAGADGAPVSVDQTAPDSQTTTIHGSYGDLVIDANGAYTYTLLHAGSNASGDTDQFTYTVTDMNGKTAQETLTFNIADDAPTLTGTGISATVSDNGVVTAAEHSATTTAELTSLVNSGADSPLTWSANAVAAGTSSSTLTGGTELTYNGAAITLDSTDGHTITGSAGGVTVFTLTVDSSGHATFVLDQTIDGAKDQTLDFSQYLKATDSDGDSVTLGTGAFTIAVDHVNHAAEIGGADSGAVTEDLSVSADGYLQASGTLTIDDADRGESKIQAATINADGTHLGTLTIGEDGSWTYKVDNSLSAVQNLGVNQSTTDRFTVSSVDGTTHDIVVTINGTNDAPTISIAGGDSASGAVTEAGIGIADDSTHNTVSGHLTGADIDSPTLTWSVVADSGQTANGSESVTGTYGTLSVGADGTWTYALDQSKADSLNTSDHPQESFTVQLSDNQGGITTQTVVVTVNGTNDAPTISIGSGDSASGAVTEAGVGVADDSAHNTVFGHLTGADVDNTSLTWSVVAGSGQTVNGGSVTGTYGTLSVGTDGTWTYTLDQSKANSLTASDHPQESFTVQLSDGQGGVTTQTVVVTVNGTNDAPTISIANGDSASGAVTEAGVGVADDSAHNSVSGHLTGADVDSTSLTWSIVAGSGQTVNGGSVTGAYGTLSVGVNGTWTYALDQSKADPLTASDHPQESFTVQLSDGQGGVTTQTVVVTVNGTNDAASISGTATGSVTEDGQLTANGVLTTADVDNGQNHFQTPTSLTGTYGTFTFNATTGVWGYTLNNSASNVQALNGGQAVTDKLTVTSADGTASQDIVVTIHGTNESVSAPSISRVADNVGSIQGNLADGAVTDDTNLGIRVSLTGTGAVSGDTVQLYNGTTALGSAVTLTATNISNGYVDITTPTLTNGSTYNFRASLTDAGTTSPLSTSGAYDIKIDTTAPTVAITQSSSGGTNVLTFTFSEAVSGFNVSDIVGSGNYTLYNFMHVGLNGSGQDVYTVNYTAGNNGWKSVWVAGSSYTDLAGNSGADGFLTAFKPAGTSGEAMNLALSAPSDHVGAVTLTVAGLPAGWVLSEGTHNADGTWSVVTNDPSSLTVTSPDGVTGALVLQVTETWINADGSTGTAYVSDNIEAYAKGAPIFAWSGDDTLTASSGNDTLVFANTIGTDVVHNFDTAHDKIDLVGFAGFSSFADVQAHLSTDASGNAVITLGDGETITLAGVSAAALTADDFLFNETVVTHNTGDMVLSDGALMPFSGTLDNTGSIHLSSTGSETAFEIVQHGLTLTGGGTVTLSDDAANVIFGSGDAVTLTNVDNTISGAGQLGDGHLTLVNEGTIIADGSHALVIDTGVNAVSNTGTLEATGTGGLDIHSSVINDGVLWANGGNINLESNVSGSGTALLSGHAGLEIGGSFSQAITLSTDAQATITIDHAAAFTGTIAGLDGNDTLRFGDISAATASFSYAENAAKTGGVLTVTDGTHTASIGLTGDYSAGDFSLGHDGDYAEIDFGHLYGTDGNDTLTSGGGYTMTGGAGADTFVLDAQALHNLNMADVITDFSPKGEGDKLDVSNLLNALVGEHPGMTEASAVASMTAAVDTATNSTKISINTGSETHVVATLQNYAPTGHDAVHVLFNNHEEQLATHTQTAGA
ncbi:VCBS domain-containing protein (plasmid) [Rhizobium sp. CB3060]|uniref:T1SS-143 repeat domain-containing protein n=1 Tax=Rhizobium sp. CB3060 TaxID=3138255 RepID=UPI0021A4ADD2|nr:VCBS domain-containing protein [Rhizobium tropici]UWU23931.1 VCBS domain-containing protein [Rhizobium tropici]